VSFTATVIRDESVNKKEKRQKEVAGYARFLSGAVMRRLWGGAGEACCKPLRQRKGICPDYFRA